VDGQFPNTLVALGKIGMRLPEILLRDEAFFQQIAAERIMESVRILVEQMLHGKVDALWGC